MKYSILSIPVLGKVIRFVLKSFRKNRNKFSGSGDYWIDRYKTGGNSGDGSYRELAEFKAEVLNDFVKENKIHSVIEYGCGDGNQLTLSEYPSYIGFDISSEALEICQRLFAEDSTKTFKRMMDCKQAQADLTLSLDVIYHLVEDNVFDSYMRQLFRSSTKYVIIYASNTSEATAEASPHVQHRKFSDWVEREERNWQLMKFIPNKHPFVGDTKEGSFADFYIYSCL